MRGHFLRVVPVFAWPAAAWALHAAVLLLTSWKANRDEARLQRSQAKMRKMLTDLKVGGPASLNYLYWSELFCYGASFGPFV